MPTLVDVDQLDHRRQEANLDTNSPDDPWSRSQLFTVRVWYELLEADDWEVRMQVKHILTDETRYFSDWGLLASYLTCKHDPPRGVSGGQM